MMNNTIPLMQDYDEIIDGIYTEVLIGSAEASERKTYRADGLWDTGSTRSCINEAIAKELGLHPDGKNIISTANGMVRVNTYCVDVEFPNGYRIPDLIVSGAKMDDNTDMLIGMDIVTMGCLNIDNDSGRTCFEYRFRKD